MLTMTRTMLLSLAMLLTLAAQPTQAQTIEEIRLAEARAVAAAKVDAGKVLDAYLTRVETDASLDDETRKAIVGLVKDARQGDLLDMAESISTGLTLTSDDFAFAMMALGEDKSEAAVRRLRKTLGADDPFLAAQSAYFLGRAYVQLERYEDAIGPLKDLIENRAAHTLYRGDALFLKGVCEAQLLNRKDAVESLSQFLREYEWTASERMYMGARTLLADLRYVEDGTLEDVEQRLTFAGRRLKLEDAGKRTQEEQERVIAMLDKLIEEAEKNEQGGGGGGGGGGGSPSSGGSGSGGGEGSAGGNASGGPAGSSSLPPGVGREGDLHDLEKNAAARWGKLPERERARVLNSIKDKFPERYAELLEKYYKGLQTEGRSEN